MRISSATKVTSALAAGILALAALVPGTASAIEHGTVHVDTGMTMVNALEVGDVHQVRGVLGLQCVVAKESYLIGYRGTLPMGNVVAKWNELKANASGGAASTLFPRLVLTGTFEFSFKVDPAAVQVDNAILTDINAWKTAYEAANTATAFPQHMILDTTKTPTYDPNTGKITVFYTLKPGLTAAELDTDYATLQELNIDTPAGLLSVSKNYMKTVTTAAGNSFMATEPRVEGKFNKPTVVTGNAFIASIVNAAMDPYFPITFDQSVSGTGTSTLTSFVTFGVKPQYASTMPGEMLPREVMDTLPAAMSGMTDPMPLAGPARGTTVMAMNPTTNESEKWEFQGWPTASYDWNEDAAFTDCRVAQPVGMWKKLPKLAQTGSDVAFQTTAAAVVLMAGAGLVALRKREAR